MSKLSFRARALDASKSMSVYECDEIPDLPDFTAINRAVPQMPTGMEKEEESEHHLQRALSAQQVYGTSENLVIPTPEITEDVKNVGKLQPGKEFKQPKQYIHVQAFNVDHEIPDYDMDSEDEVWLAKQTKKMEVVPIQFEEMMDRLEKGSGQTVVTLPEAKMLLKEDDDLIIAVYDYWLNKRLRTQHHLIPGVKTEKRDGSTTNNPYVAFRRRTEKMQTRKNRKNDEVSYEKMLKLRRDLSKAVTQLEMIKRREKTKKELLQLTIEIVEKRFQMGDFNGEKMAEAMAQKHVLPTYIPVNQFAMGREWAGLGRKDESAAARKRRDSKKRKHRPSGSTLSSHHHGASSSHHQRLSVHVPQYSEVDVLGTEDVYSSGDEELLSPEPLSPSDHEEENDPDGVYGFKRMKGCSYLAPKDDRLSAWPWSPGELSNDKYRYSLTSISEPRRCVGYARRRFGRGGRLLLDRAFSEHDDQLKRVDLMDGHTYQGDLHQFNQYIRQEKIPHFQPRAPSSPLRCVSPPLLSLPEELNFSDSGLEDTFNLDLKSPTDPWSDLTASLTPEGLIIDANPNVNVNDLLQSNKFHQLLAASSSRLNSSHLRHSQPSSSSSTTVPAPTTTQHQLSTGSKEVSETSSSSIPSTSSQSQACDQINSDLGSSALSTSPSAQVLQLNYPITTTSFNQSKEAGLQQQPISDQDSVMTSQIGVTSSSQNLTSQQSDASILSRSLLRFTSTSSHDHDESSEVVNVDDSDAPSSPVPTMSETSINMPMEVT